MLRACNIIPKLIEVTSPEIKRFWIYVFLSSGCMKWLGVVSSDFLISQSIKITGERFFFFGGGERLGGEEGGI